MTSDDLISGRAEAVTDFLQRRRSVVARNQQTEPIPDADLNIILSCGIRVPDHGALAPWRIVVIDKQAGAWLGEEILAPAFQAEHSDATEAMLTAERNRFLRGGVVLAVLSTPQESKKIPLWEMELSAGAVCTNLVVAATALGYGAQWLTEWPAYNKAVLSALGGAENTDKIAGFIYVGQRQTEPEERRRPDPQIVISRLTVPNP